MPGLGNFGDRYFGTTTPEQEPIRPTHRSPIHQNRPVFNEIGSDALSVFNEIGSDSLSEI